MYIDDITFKFYSKDMVLIMVKFETILLSKMKSYQKKGYKYKKHAF